jgi:MFS family permease
MYPICDAPRMSKGVRARFSAPLRAFAGVFGNANLRRLLLAWSGFFIADWAYAIAIAIFAYMQGGPLAVGLVEIAQTVPAALAAPFSALLSDRYPRQRVYVAANLARALLLLILAGAAFAHAAPVVLYLLASLNAVVTTTFWSTETALLPTLARSPEELTAANAASTTIESIGTMVGPALGGIVGAVAGLGSVFAMSAGIFLLAAFSASRIRAGTVSDRERRVAGRSGVVHDLAEGLRAIRGATGVLLLVGLLSAEWLMRGALTVLVVVTALDLLDLGQPGVGFLHSAFGVGALIGALGSLALVGRRRLASPLGVGVVAWGIPVALIPVWPVPGAALALLAVVGVANSLADVSGYTLLQRTVPERVLGRVLGVVEGSCWFTFGIGAIGVPLLISAVGISWTLAICGLFLPLLIVALWRGLTAIDERAIVPVERIELLRSIPMFEPLSLPKVERLASELIERKVPAGTEIIREGEPGDRFYIVAEGVVDVYAAGKRLSSLEAGDHFGEIALVRDVPRTATVVARIDVVLYALERDEFLKAVTGHAQSAERADAVIGARLARLGGHTP